MAHHLDRIGQQITDYRFLRWLGGGGFGDVYLAEQIQDHSQVAIKLLHIRLSSSEELKAFVNEARTIRLQHPHIVPLLDFGVSEEETPFLVMEYATEGTLRDRHPKGSQVPLALVVDYARQVSSALQYAHEQRLIHRDVKPQNMLLRADGTVLLSDFGLVTVIDSSDSQSSHQEPVGTIAYMAPEQVQGQAQAASDQYSLGVAVYEWITGRRPFEGTTVEVGMQHVVKPPPSLVAQVPTLSSAVEEVVLKALAKDPSNRFVTVQDFTSALEETVRGAPAMPDKYKTSPIGSKEQVLSPDMVNLLISSSEKRPASRPRVDWGDALAVTVFYGREQEQAQLSQWMLQEDCRVVSVLGMGGIGKSALSVRMMYQLAVGTAAARPCPFEVVIFRPLRDAPSCEELLADCLQVLSSQPLNITLASLEQRLSLLVEHLRKSRTLLVLDNLESLLSEGDVRGHFRPGFEGYGQLLRRVAEADHQSCLLFTSREKPAELRLLEGRYSSVRSLRLAGLDVAACKHLLEKKGLAGIAPEQAQLIELYGGNPLALMIVAQTIIDLFAGEIGLFLATGTVLFSSITELLDEQFARLSALEQSVLCWLAIMRESVTLDELQALLVSLTPRIRLLEAVDSLRRRSLIERGKPAGSFTLQSVVMEYVTAVLIAEGSREIRLRQLDRLIEHGLSQAHAKEYVRQTQERLLLSPLLANLHSAYQRRAAGAEQQTVGTGLAPVRIAVEEQLLGLLDALRGEADSAQGYGPANLIALLRLQRGHLSGLDLSQLCVRGAYLQSIEMQDVSMAGALIRDTVLTEAVNATWVVAISPDGRWWAAGSLQGKVCVWEEGSQTLHRIWQAHGTIVYSLAFSPDGRTLATGSHDNSVKLWDVESGALLWTSWHRSVQSLAFTPDGSLLASAGGDATVQLWETGSHGACPRGTSLQTLRHASQVWAVAFSPDGHLLASGCSDGQMRLWERHQSESCTYVEILSQKTSWVRDLAFAPDGRTLASAHLDPSDRAVKLWEVGSFRLLHTLPELQGRCIAWSPDGRVLAGYCDKTVWLWDVEQGRIRSALHGHAAEVYSLTFAPDSGWLLSGSVDGMLRVWDVEGCQCVRVIAGYGVTIANLGWSPDSTHLVSGGSDALVTIWDVSGEALPRVLRGHSWVVSGVGWSPDGRYLASCGWDRTVRLWDATSHTSVQIFEAPTLLMCMAWSPDGSLLACGTLQRGVQVWDVRARSLRFVGQPSRIMFINVAWSPDGTRLAGSAEDGSVYLWESANGTLLEKLPGHHGLVFGAVWSPDGTRLASGSGGEGGGELFVWDVQNVGAGARQDQALSKALDQPGAHPCPVQTFAGHSGQVYAVVWSRSHGACPRGDWLISGDTDGMLRWWDVETAECVCTRAAHEGTIRSLRVSPDGRWLGSCGDDGIIKIWDLHSGEYVRTLRHDRPYERLNITGIRGLNEAQKASLQALGAVEEVTSSL